MARKISTTTGGLQLEASSWRPPVGLGSSTELLESLRLHHSVCCFVLLTCVWGRLERRPPIALGSSPVFFGALTMCLLFVCLFVGIKTEKLYSISCIRREVTPLGVVTHGQRHKPRAYQRQRHKPRTCQSMVNTVQVDVPGLTPALYKAHPQPPKGVTPCLVWRVGFGRGDERFGG